MDINQDLTLGVDGLLIFEISSQQFCSDMRFITAILSLKEASSNSSKMIKSEIQFNGDNYKLINIYKILNFNAVKQKSETRIILFDIFQKKFGFIVDKVSEILTTEKIFVNKSLDMILSSAIKYVKGYLIFENRKILLLDFERITKELNKLCTVDNYRIAEKRMSE